jgi:NADPH-dependent ferric siderophore reductase
VTHAFNMGQRYLSLDLNQDDATEIQLTAPNDPKLAPPGHYLLFVVDAAGVPAVAPIVQLVYV